VQSWPHSYEAITLAISDAVYLGLVISVSGGQALAETNGRKDHVWLTNTFSSLVSGSRNMHCTSSDPPATIRLLSLAEQVEQASKLHIGKIIADLLKY
jgi:hypothetical protein